MHRLSHSPQRWVVPVCSVSLTHTSLRPLLLDSSVSLARTILSLTPSPSFSRSLVHTITLSLTHSRARAPVDSRYHRLRSPHSCFSHIGDFIFFHFIFFFSHFPKNVFPPLPRKKSRTPLIERYFFTVLLLNLIAGYAT